jgi:hypothetical protein
MKSLTDTGIFKPAASRAEAKNDTTTRMAREIIDREANAMKAKTERLRVARLAQESDAPPAPVAKKPRKKR